MATPRPFRIRARVAIAAVALLAGSAPPARAAPRNAAIEIPFEQFTLPNGLRVVVHTDHETPIVAVNVSYHVGSKNEPRGRSGFAHLFEHLMFEASEHRKGEFFTALEPLGATQHNGSTYFDITNFIETVPTTALDAALWLESDRMGYLLGAIDQASIDKQRGIVQNEKRQSEDPPYGQATALYLAGAFPIDHPYRHRTIGSMNDLNAATLDDVRSWSRSWYGPNNAVLVLAGDIDLATAKDKVTRYFGDLPPSAAVPVRAPQIAPRTVATRATATDAVPQTRIYKVWNVPPFGTADAARLQVLQQILVESASSRLARRLQFRAPLADAVSSSLQALEIAGFFVITADVKLGVDPAAVDAAIEDELAALVARGPTADEVAQARAILVASFARSVERVGWYRGKADTLAACQLLTGDPGCYRARLATIEATTAAQVQAVARRWLRRGAFTLRIDPGERTPLVEEATPAIRPAAVPPAPRGLRALAPIVDRTLGVPAPDRVGSLRFPAVKRATLRNGLRIVLAERRGLPLIQMRLALPGAGFASDRGRKPGTAGFALAMIGEAAGRYDALSFAARKEALGAEIEVSGTLDVATVMLSAMKSQLDESLALLGDVVLRPRLADDDIERVRGMRLASIRQEKARASDLALRLAGPALYGTGHPYAVPSSGTGSEEGVEAITRADLSAWLAQSFRPDTATLIIVGDTDLTEIVPALEDAFAGWAVTTAPPPYAVPAATRPSQPRVWLIDQPGATQSTLLVGQAVPSSLDASETDLDLATALFGGGFTSRLPMNLRGDKQWAYRVSSQVTDAVGPRAWTATAAVQADKTAESAREMQREILQYVTAKVPATAGELAKLRTTTLHAMPAAYESGSAVLAALGAMALYHRPDDYPQRRADRIAALTIQQLQAAAGAIQPAALTWIIVGDLKKIEAPIRALGLGDVQRVDSAGRVIR